MCGGPLSVALVIEGTTLRGNPTIDADRVASDFDGGSARGRVRSVFVPTHLLPPGTQHAQITVAGEPRVVQAVVAIDDGYVSELVLTTT